MINNQKCLTCDLATKCLAKAKLKAFTSDAKTDLRVVLDFVSCPDYKKAKEEKETK